MIRMETIDNPTQTKRYYLLDLIRFFSMIAITEFHSLEAFFYSNESAVNRDHFFEWGLFYFSRFISFSGFTIIMLSFFLIGLKGLSKQKLKKLGFICFIGSTILFFVYQESGWQFEWDIYSFIAAGSLILALVARNHKILWLASALSVILLALPSSFYDFPQFQNHWLYNPLVGNYYLEGAGGWPLLPWVGLIILFYHAGSLIRKRPKLKIKLPTISNAELLFWFVILAFASPQLGAFFDVPVGPDFAKFVNQMDRIDQWSHFIFVIFFMRLAFVEKVNLWLSKRRSVRFISNLHLNRRFFMFYILQWFLIGLASEYSQQFLANKYLYDLWLISAIPLTEVTCTLFLKVSKKLSNLSIKRPALSA